MRSFVVVTLVSLLTLAGEQSTVADGPLPDLDELRRGFAERDASFQNLSFRVTYHAKLRKGPRGGPLLDKVQVADVVLDTSQGAGPVNNRARVETMTTLDPDVLDLVPEGTEWTRMITVVTPGGPEGGRSLGTARDPATKEPVPSGSIDEHSGVRWLAYPSELLSLNYWSPSHHLNGTPKTWEVGGPEVIAGHEALRLSWTVEGGGPSVQRGTYWVAPRLGHAVLRSVVERRPSPEWPWREIMRIECDEFEEVDGLWLPDSAQMVEHIYYDEDGGHELRKEIHADFENWAVNQEVPEETYQLEFPKGTVVRDFTRGDVTYIAGRIDDAEVSRQVDQARQLAATTPPPASDLVARFEGAMREDPLAGRTPWLGLGLGVAGALIVAGLAVWLIRGRRRHGVETGS